jgi:hypothetical protein
VGIDEVDNQFWGRVGLIGDTGFVGSELGRQIPFSKSYNSRTIDRIAGERFDTLICAGAPATMWIANAQPNADLDNLNRLTSALGEAKAGRVVLISTIAVFADAAAGYTESNARYETVKAYGRNRRELELHILERYKAVVLRLPALFGTGLKKNFIFDILNPIPSFVKPEKFATTRTAFTTDERQLSDDVFAFDAGLGLHRLNRAALEASGKRRELEQAFARVGFLASSFTNSDSEYQFYNLAHLANDIKSSLAHDLVVLNVCSEPWRAGDLHAALLGAPFVNKEPSIVREDVHTEHANAFARRGHYLYDRASVLRDLHAFVAVERC